MRLTVVLLVLLTLAVPPRTAAQATEPDQATTPAGSPPGAPPQTPVPSQFPPPSPPFDRPISWKLLLPNLIADQKQMWSFPAKLVQGKDWIPTAAALGTSAGLMLFDPTEAGYFPRTSTFHAFDNIFTGNATLAGILAAPASLYAVGLIRKDPKMQHTALLAGEAVADSELLTTVLKRCHQSCSARRPPEFGKPLGFLV
ncbi:MAG TPA: hypothetical protein VIY49_31955 [Bryobacteraceae bacterium]